METDYDKHTRIALDLLDTADALGGITTMDEALVAAQVHSTLAVAAATLAAAAPAMVQAAAQLDAVAGRAQQLIQELRSSEIQSEAKTSRICGMDEVAGIAREQARYLRHVAGAGESK
jgi:uncharacterized protein YmfQ (DUF2313 family)